MEKTKVVLKIILASQEELLDGMLYEQSCIHKSVQERRWEGMEGHMSRMEAYGKGFLDLDQKRESLGDYKELLNDKEISDLVSNVRSKLVKSRIENDALTTYVKATQEFVTGVIESCASRERNTVYTRFGNVKKPAVQSVVVNRLM